MSTQVIARPFLAARGSNFLFVDNIRYVTMWALFFEHTIVGSESVLSRTPHMAMTFGLCFSKFGSIAFFLASGFLLGSNLDRQSDTAYMQKRFSRVFLPWLFWFSVFCAALVYLNVHHGRTPIIFGVNACQVVLGWVKFALDSPYWFVPNLMFSLCCLLLVRRLVGDRASGVIWALASLFYAANVYLRWLPTSHRCAWLGFVFYLWLGVFCAKRFSSLRRILSETSYSTILVTLAFLWMCGVAEYGLVAHLHPQDDPGNSIRITNQLFSLCAVFLIAKARTRLYPKFIDVREDTFGLYLLQPFVLYTANVALAALVRKGFLHGNPNPGLHASLWIVCSVLVYFTAPGRCKGDCLDVPTPLEHGLVRRVESAAPCTRSGNSRAPRLGVPGHRPDACGVTFGPLPAKAKNTYASSNPLVSSSNPSSPVAAVDDSGSPAGSLARPSAHGCPFLEGADRGKDGIALVLLALAGFLYLLAVGL